jgi:hypothetical protein
MALDAQPGASPAASRPWQDLPAGLSTLLSDAIPSIASEVVDVMSAAIPEYRVPDVRFARDVRRGVEGALEDFAALIGHRRPVPGARRSLYAGLGQQEWRSGRSLDALHAAYHLGARVVWRRISGLATAAGADPATVSLLADSVFAYLDEVAAVSADGFAAASAAAAGQTERQRQRLLAALLGHPHPDARALEPLARSAAWPLPRTAATVAVCDPDDGVTARRLPHDVLVGVADGIGCIVVPDPDGPGRPGQLAYALANAAGAVLGPTVPLAHTARSWERALAVWRLAADGRIDDQGLQRADDHLTTLLLAGEPQLIDDLARLRLAPIDAQPRRSRERLEATLLAYLRHRGNGPRIAADLHVHPQTVRYRMARLRELLGDALDDAETRFELEVVLRARASAARPSAD